MISFVLLDETDGAVTGSGEGLTPDKLTEAAALLHVFLNRDVGAYWGLPGGAVVRAGASPADINENEWPFHIRAQLLDAPGAIAYHTVNGFGVPDLYDAITLSQTLFGPGGWLQAASHEIAETVVDPGTNILCSNGAGLLFAREVCDAIEVDSYLITVGHVSGYASNFLLPPFFVPTAHGPYDYMTAQSLHPAGERGPQQPFETVPSGGGNYQIEEDDPQDEQQVTAFGVPEGVRRRVRFAGSLAWRLDKKVHFTSRAYRRGLRITPEEHAQAASQRVAFDTARRVGG